MGKILTIRLMAQTYDEDEVGKAWPGLCALLWPEWSLRQGLKRLGGAADTWPVLEPNAIEKSLGVRTHGVVELGTALGDYVRFADFSGVTAESCPMARAWRSFLTTVEDVVSQNKALAEALADWDVKGASAASNRLEDALDRAEKALPPAN